MNSSSSWDEQRAVRRQRPPRSALRILGIVLLVLTTPVLCCFGNPMLLAFITEVRVTNASGEPVLVAPYGIPEGGAVLARLPLYLTKWPIGIPRTGSPYSVSAGASASILYDWDDINFCWLVVRGHAGPARVLRTKQPPENCPWPPARAPCCSHPEPSLVIPPLEDLPLAKEVFADIDERELIPTPE